jgi:DNA helicase-2/ATP-dependent DNA helicase PcrA
MMVGDPNQAIYGFNGSTSSYMKEDFVKDFNAETKTLEDNYRCSKAVIEASNKLINLNTEASQYAINGIFEIKETNSENDEATFVLNKIKELIEIKSHNDIEGKIDYSKIAILARNKFVFKNVEDKLKSESIPYYYKSGNSGIKFSSKPMKIFDFLFRVKINPLDKLHQKKLEELLKVDDLNNSDAFQKSKFPISSNVKKIVDEITIENLHLKLEELKILFTGSILDNDDEKKFALEELEDFNNQLTQYKKQNLKPTLEGFKSAVALGLTEIVTTKEIGVCLSTVHTMKGQENEIVFLIGMDEGTFPDYRAINKGGEELQQEKNNTYVAFTRAKRFLFVSYPKTRIMPWGDTKSRTLSQFIKPLLK